MDIRQPNPTQAAGILRAFLKEQGIELKHTAALEAVARTAGFTDWQAMAANQKERSERDADCPQLLQLDPKGDDNSDFVYVDNPGNRGVWVSIGNISAYLKPTDEGVVVDLFAKGAEDQDASTSTYLHYDEALAELCERHDVDLKDVQQWAKETTGAEFDTESPARKAELVDAFARSDRKAPPPGKATPDRLADWVLQTTGRAIGEVSAERRTRLTALYAQREGPGEPRYVFGEWEHIFQGKNVSQVRFVFDQEENRVVHLDLRSSPSSWFPAADWHIRDVEDSLKNANYEVLARPFDEGLHAYNELPHWAKNR